MCAAPGLGLALAQSLRKLYPKQWETGKLNTLLLIHSPKRRFWNKGCTNPF